MCLSLPKRTALLTVVTLVLITACHVPSESTAISALAGDGITDDRPALQALLNQNAGGILHLPAARYLLSKSPVGYYCLTVPASTTLEGEPGTILVQAVVSESTRLLEVDTANVTLRDLELDGQRALQTPSEHRSGVFAYGAQGLVVDNVTSHDFTGDGITIHTGSNNVQLTNVQAHSNGRSGIALTGCTTGTQIVNATVYGNVVKGLHTEPGVPCHVDGVTVLGGTFTASSDWAISIAGSSARSANWLIDGATITGGLYVTSAQDALVTNTVIAGTARPAVQVYRHTDGVTVQESQLSSAGPSVVEITGTDAANIPDHTTISGNLITSGAAATMGVHAVSARTVTVQANQLTGFGVTKAYAYGVYARSIVPASNLALTVLDNDVAAWGATGLVVADTGGGLASVSVNDNVFSGVTEKYGMSLPLGAVQAGNTIGSGMVSLFAP